MIVTSWALSWIARTRQPEKLSQFDLAVILIVRQQIQLVPPQTPPRHAFDDLDRQLIKLPFEDAEMPVADLALRIGLTVGPFRTRIQRLFETGLLVRRNVVPEEKSQWQSIRLVILKFPDNTADTLRIRTEMPEWPAQTRAQRAGPCASIPLSPTVHNALPTMTSASWKSAGGENQSPAHARRAVTEQEKLHPDQERAHEDQGREAGRDPALAAAGPLPNRERDGHEPPGHAQRAPTLARDHQRVEYIA
ncbi:DNA-binding Lrp family transcriptional regulator [Bradyrhizobium sp. F1.13.1]